MLAKRLTEDLISGYSILNGENYFSRVEIIWYFKLFTGIWKRPQLIWLWYGNPKVSRMKILSLLL